jgi:hypothetical protein
MNKIKIASLACIGVAFVSLWATYFAIDASTPISYMNSFIWDSITSQPSARYDRELSQQFLLYMT